MDSGLDNAMITGFRGIDGEHHVQLELLGALRSVLTAGEERGRIDEILEQLVDYTKVHFASEQLLMRLYNYPHIQQHQADHGRAAGCGLRHSLFPLLPYLTTTLTMKRSVRMKRTTKITAITMTCTGLMLERS